MLMRDQLTELSPSTLCRKKFEGHFGLDEKFIDLAMKMSEIVEEGFNFLHVEASEILITDSDRVAKPGIPPHIPIAYGLHGSAMSMETMQNMIKDLRKELHDRNCTVLFEVYDG